MKKIVVVGSRDSQLALTQTHWIIGKLQQLFPEITFEIKNIKTEGDKVLDVALAKIGGKGLFVKEIEQALLTKEIDFAVHSMKDVPTTLPEGLTIAAVTKREDPRDCYIAKDGQTGLTQARLGAVIGTSSLRRSAQLLHYRPDLQIVPMRGNLNTRFRKLAGLELDGMILAYAGVFRLGWEERITEMIEIEQSLPAVGQGALGIEVRQADEQVMAMVAMLNDPLTSAAVMAERDFLHKLEGGCQVPIGAFGRVEGETLVLDGMVAGIKGETILRSQVQRPLAQAAGLGQELAEILLAQGAAKILQAVREEVDAHA